MTHSNKLQTLFTSNLPLDTYLKKDLSLITALKTPLKLNEYISVPDPGFQNQDFSLGNHAGNVNTVLGILHVYRMVFDNNTLWYALIDPNIGQSSPLCYILFKYMDDLPLLRKNAFCVTEYRGKGLISELNLFIAKVDAMSMISDTKMTLSGVKVWEKMFRMYPNHCGIYHGPTKTIFSRNLIGSIQNGIKIVDPVNDNQSEKYWFQDPILGQKWFYIFQSFNESLITEDEHYNFNAIHRNLESFYPYYSFGDGYE